MYLLASLVLGEFQSLYLTVLLVELCFWSLELPSTLFDVGKLVRVVVVVVVVVVVLLLPIAKGGKSRSYITKSSRLVIHRNIRFFLF